MERRSLNILVVSEDPARYQFLAAVITEGGDDSTHATDAIAALSRAKVFKPDIVMADLTPDAGGEAFIRELEATCDGDLPYLIALLPRGNHKRLMESLDSRIDDFISPPLHREVLAARLAVARRLLDLRRANNSFATQIRDYSEELASLHFRLRELVVNDVLTGLPNRQQAMVSLEKAWAVSRRENSPLACVAVLLAGLRQINHRYGHERGDVTLKTVAALLKTELGVEDSLYRINGNEFLMICPGIALDAALGFGKRVHGILRETFGNQAEGMLLGLRIGIAERSPDVTSAQVLVNLASYSAQRARRTDGDLPYAVQSGRLQPLRMIKPRSSRPRRSKAISESDLSPAAI